MERERQRANERESLRCIELQQQHQQQRRTNINSPYKTTIVHLIIEALALLFSILHRHITLTPPSYNNVK